MIIEHQTIIGLINQHWRAVQLVTVRLYTVMLEVCRWLTDEKQRKTDIRLTDQ